MRRRESLGGRLLSREGKASWPLVPKVKVPAVSRRSDSTDHVTTLSRAPSLVDYCAPVAYRYAPPSKRRGIYELTTGGKEIHSYPPSQAWSCDSHRASDPRLCSACSRKNRPAPRTWRGSRESERLRRRRERKGHRPSCGARRRHSVLRSGARRPRAVPLESAGVAARGL